MYGDDDLVVILEHYKGTLEEANVDPAETELEWTALKKELYDE